MPKLVAFLRNPFSFLFARTAMEERVAEYLIREHHRGRTVDEILQDRFVVNRTSPQQLARVLERTDVIHAVSTDDLDAARRYLDGISAG